MPARQLPRYDVLDRYRPCSCALAKKAKIFDVNYMPKKYREKHVSHLLVSVAIGIKNKLGSKVAMGLVRISYCHFGRFRRLRHYCLDEQRISGLPNTSAWPTAE